MNIPDNNEQEKLNNLFKDISDNIIYSSYEMGRLEFVKKNSIFLNLINHENWIVKEILDPPSVKNNDYFLDEFYNRVQHLEILNIKQIIKNNIKKEENLEEDINNPNIIENNFRSMVSNSITAFDLKDLETKLPPSKTRVFLLGTGPSIKHINLDLLNNEFTIGLNQINKGFNISNINFSTTMNVHSYWNDISYCLNIDNRNLIFNKKANFIINFLENYNQLYNDNFELGGRSHIELIEKAYPILQKTHPVKSLWVKTAGVLHIADSFVRFLIMLGYKEIYLLGMDMPYRTEHFYDSNFPLSIPKNMPINAEEKQFWTERLSFNKYFIILFENWLDIIKKTKNKNINIYNLSLTNTYNGFMPNIILKKNGKYINDYLKNDLFLSS